MAPDEPDEPVAEAAQQDYAIATVPAVRDRRHVADEPDATDDGRRWDRSAAGLVVERHVPRDDRDAEGLRRARDAFDRLSDLPADLRLLGVTEVETVGEGEGLAAGAGDVHRSLHDGPPAGLHRIAAAERRAVERHGDPSGAVDAEDCGVEAGAAHGARTDEVVVLLEHPGLRLVVDRGDRNRSDLTRDLLDLVARALVRQERGRDGTDDLLVEEAAQLAVVGHLADHRAWELPPLAHRAHLVEPLRRHDGDHPLLRLGDHDLPRLEILFAKRHPVEVDVDAHVTGHLRQRRREPRGAAVLQRDHELLFDELERDLDQRLPAKRVADLDRRPLLVRAFEIL